MLAMLQPIHDTIIVLEADDTIALGTTAIYHHWLMIMAHLQRLMLPTRR